MTRSATGPCLLWMPPPPSAKTPTSWTLPTWPWTLPSGTPPLARPAAETPERRRPVLALDAAARGQDTTDLALDAAACPARAAGRR